MPPRSVREALAPFLSPLRAFGLHPRVHSSQLVTTFESLYSALIISALTFKSLSKIHERIIWFYADKSEVDYALVTSEFISTLTLICTGLISIPLLIFDLFHVKNYEILVSTLKEISIKLNIKSSFIKFLWQTSWSYFIIFFFIISVTLVKFFYLWSNYQFDDMAAAMLLCSLHVLVEVKFLLLVVSKRWLYRFINCRIKVRKTNEPENSHRLFT